MMSKVRIVVVFVKGRGANEWRERVVITQACSFNSNIWRCPFLFFIYFVYLFMRDRDREAEAEEEAVSPRSRDPNTGLNPWTLGPRPKPKADAQPPEPPGHPRDVCF